MLLLDTVIGCAACCTSVHTFQRNLLKINITILMLLLQLMVVPQVFQEIHRVLKPGGKAYMSFSNRCFPTKGELARCSLT
jgi:SAM-dependent methyltransferase